MNEAAKQGAGSISVLDDVEAAAAGVLDVEVERWFNEMSASSYATAELEETLAVVEVDFPAETPVPDALPSVADTIDALIAQAATAAADAAAATAAQMAAMTDVVELACRNRGLFLGSADNTGPGDNAEAVGFARRAAVAELAVSLHVSENTVNAFVATTKLLRSQLPTTWTALQNGELSYAKASIIADQAATLAGQVSAETMAAFDTGLVEAAGRLTPAKLRQKARGLRERLHPEPAVDRHVKAMANRRVCVEADLDGMAWFNAHLPAEIAHGAWARIDAAARNLATLPNEDRTLEQLRADAAGDILTGAGTPNEVRTVVNVTVPVLTLVDADGQRVPDARRQAPATPLQNLSPAGATPRIDPAMLEGYGPIDADTARRLTGEATTLYRILVDPVEGSPITVDRKKYRPGADLKRLVKARFATCCFPGCNRPAERCDLDHTEAFTAGGDTDAENLAPLCRHHHRVKHNTGWVMRRTPTASVQWVSPRGVTHDTDPPPF